MNDPVSISIRAARTKDAAEISALVSQLSREFIVPDYSPFGAATLLGRQTPEAIAACYGGKSIALVAEGHGAIVGVVSLLLEKRHLFHLFVASAFQRRGLGRRLWDAARAEAGPGPITVNSSRLAVPVYRRLGFVDNGPKWEKDGVIAFPMLWREAELGPPDPRT